MWLMLTKAFVALKHAEYLVTLLLLVAAVLTCTPQGDLHTGVTDIVGCHGCACPKPHRLKKYYESCYTKGNAALEAEAFHCDKHVTQARSGVPARWPRLDEPTWSLLSCEKVLRLLPLTQALWDVLRTETGVSIKLWRVHSRSNVENCTCRAQCRLMGGKQFNGASIKSWRTCVGWAVVLTYGSKRYSCFLCSWQHCVARYLLTNKYCTRVVCHSGSVHLAQNQQSHLKMEGIVEFYSFWGTAALYVLFWATLKTF